MKSIIDNIKSPLLFNHEFKHALEKLRDSLDWAANFEVDETGSYFSDMITNVMTLFQGRLNDAVDAGCFKEQDGTYLAVRKEFNDSLKRIISDLLKKIHDENK